MSTEDRQRPSISDLSVLHLISHLSNDKSSLDLADEGSGGQFASMNLSSLHFREDLVHLSDLAYLSALYLEASYELQRAQIIDTDLPWPDDGDWNDSEMRLTSLFERIRDVLKNGNRTSSISLKATLTEIYEYAPETSIRDGVLKGNMSLVNLFLLEGAQDSFRTLH